MVSPMAWVAVTCVQLAPHKVATQAVANLTCRQANGHPGAAQSQLSWPTCAWRHVISVDIQLLRHTWQAETSNDSYDPLAFKVQRLARFSRMPCCSMSSSNAPASKRKSPSQPVMLHVHSAPSPQGPAWCRPCAADGPATRTYSSAQQPTPEHKLKSPNQPVMLHMCLAHLLRKVQRGAALVQQVVQRPARAVFSDQAHIWRRVAGANEVDDVGVPYAGQNLNLAVEELQAGRRSRAVL